MPRNTATEGTRKVRHSPMEHPRHQYPQETALLQSIAKNCGLAETIKWGKPCYMLDGRKVVLIQRFNDYIALMFFKGALLKDPKKLLFRIGEHTQGPRQLRFNSVADVARLEPTIKAYIAEAIKLEQTGANIQKKGATEYGVPDELQTRLKTDSALRAAFSALTPGRQKGYILQIAAARKSATRASRVEQCAPRILAGKGLND